MTATIVNVRGLWGVHLSNRPAGKQAKKTGPGRPRCKPDANDMRMKETQILVLYFQDQTEAAGLGFGGGTEGLGLGQDG
jgi:hypothetical protein